jgi:hypothetical protein
VLFSGSVPGDKRGPLVEQFHEDPDCRLFLSTDAGGVGLNLQHAAAVVVNMDLPWNPAVLEQRIGRVHRMGQSRGVQVINFVGQGCIEEGMLSVLAFKKSLFAGVLDGGDHEVFMQGTRLSQFMKSVEQVAGAMGEDEAESGTDIAEAPEASAPDKAPADAQAEPVPDLMQPALPIEPQDVSAQDRSPLVAASAPEAPCTPADVGQPGVGMADPWAAVLQAGAALLQGLAAGRQAAGPGALPIQIERDPVTGQASVRLPMPDPAVLRQLARAFEPWLRQDGRDAGGGSTG